MPKKTINDIDVAGKQVLIRVDFNTPLKDGSITDDRRIRAALPTIKDITDRGGRAILISHLGRPTGEGFQPELSLKPIAARLSELLTKPVAFPADDCLGPQVAPAIADMKDSDILLLENLRFNKGEKSGDAGFAQSLADYADIYVNDAFGTCHRSDASMVGVPKAMANKPRVVGLLVEKEVRFLSETLSSPAQPFIVVLGGAKVSDKLPAIDNLLPKADHIIIGGAMAYTFLAALGRNVGSSKVELDKISDAKRIIEHAANHHCELHLPCDHICSTQFAQHAGDIEVFADDIKDGFMGLDIGPQTQANFASVISKAKTIVWNGPMGVFEWAPFKIGTRSIANAIAEATTNGATSIVGGGDSAAAIESFKLNDSFTHISTGGGASLEMLEGKPFEALNALDNA